MPEDEPKQTGTPGWEKPPAEALETPEEPVWQKIPEDVEIGVRGKPLSPEFLERITKDRREILINYYNGESLGERSSHYMPNAKEHFEKMDTRDIRHAYVRMQNEIARKDKNKVDELYLLRKNYDHKYGSPEEYIAEQKAKTEALAHMRHKGDTVYEKIDEAADIASRGIVAGMASCAGIALFNSLKTAVMSHPYVAGTVAAVTAVGSGIYYLFS